MDKIVELFLKYGLLPTCLLIVVFLIVQEPDRAVKLKVILTKPFFRFFRWFSKEHISSKVSSQANEFLNSSIFSQLSHSDRYQLKVKWVKEPNDPILSRNGTLILRMKEEDDQTKNILAAVHAALPHVLCPLLRKNINLTCNNSIDLTILKKLSEKLGNHGRIAFKKYFLDPQTEVDAQINELIIKLQKLDKQGFLMPIFLNELEFLSEVLFANNDMQDYSDDVLGFLNYLLEIADREVGSENQLDYLVAPFKVSIILLARAHRADLQGVRPYINRLKINLDKGSETIYFIGYQPAFQFFERLAKSLDSYERVFVRKKIKTFYSDSISNSQNNLKICVVTRNDIYADELFEQKIKDYKIEIGGKVKGIVEDISHNESSINVFGMTAYIAKIECSWLTLRSCEEVLEKGKEFDFLVKKIDKSSNLIHLSLKHSAQNPWNLIPLPEKNDIIEIQIVSNDNSKFNCIYKDQLQVYIKIGEASWFFLTDNQMHELLGKYQTVKVIERDEENQIIYCSIRQLDQNPWPIIHQSLAVGTEFNGKVKEVTPNYVQVELPNNYIGLLPKEALEKGGYEYKNFQDNMIKGQGVDVFISKIFINRERIRLDLTRNKRN